VKADGAEIEKCLESTRYPSDQDGCYAFDSPRSGLSETSVVVEFEEELPSGQRFS
jgi:hypothetical protein